MKAVVLNNPQRSFLFFLQAFQPIKMSKQPLVGDIAPSSPMSPSSFAARQWQTSVPPPLFPIPTPIENPLSAHLFASCVLRRRRPARAIYEHKIWALLDIYRPGD